MSDTPSTKPETPTPEPAAGAPVEPFVRGRIVWGRPPETVFRAGPLPRPPQSWSQPMARSAPAQSRPNAGILSGSMVPGPAPTPRPQLAPRPETADAPQRSPVAPPEIQPTSVAQAAPEPEVQAEPAPSPIMEAEAPPPVSPEPAVPPPTETVLEAAPIGEPGLEAVDDAPAAVTEPDPEPVVAPAPEPEPARGRGRSTVEIIVEPEAPEQIDTRPPLSTADAGPADPRSAPSVVVTPTLYARVEAVVGQVKKNDRWLIAAAVGAVVVTGGFIWLATLPSGDAVPLDMDAPPPAAPGVQPPLTTGAAPAPPVEVQPPVVAEPTEAPAVVNAAPAPSTARPARRAPAPVEPAAPATRAAPPATEAPAPPAIETAPLVVDPPTSAAPPPADPDAPMETRPQPLN